MSLGGYIFKSGYCDETECYTAKEAAELENAIGRATAPGGDFQYAFVSQTETCTVAGLTRPCYVLSDIPGGFSWAAGTSMAATHVSASRRSSSGRTEAA